jgi:hypothetical protein
MLLLTAMVIPVRVCMVEDWEVNNWLTLDDVFTYYFFADMGVCFVSAYTDEKNCL